MTSNAYIASDGKTVLKVGKTNNFWKRMKQIDLPMTAIISCPDEATALLIETELRNIVLEMGGIRYPEKVDWFEFDSDIHMMLQAFLESLRGYVPKYINGYPDGEITRLRKEYVQGLKDLQQQKVKEYFVAHDRQEREIQEMKAKVVVLEREIASLGKEQTRLQKELKEEREKKYELIQEVGRLEGQIKGLRSWAKGREQTPLDAEVLLNILSSLLPEDSD